MSEKENQEKTESTLSEDVKKSNDSSAERVNEGEKTPEEKYAELNDKYIRLYADFENFRRRSTKERLELLKFASEETFRQLLPILDDFERAFKSMPEVSDISIIRQGQELIYNKLKNILIQNGLQEMKAFGEIFNPDLHEAITNVPVSTEDQKGKVIEEVEKGYYLNGKVIRHAKVIVGN